MNKQKRVRLEPLNGVLFVLSVFLLLDIFLAMNFTVILFRLALMSEAIERLSHAHWTFRYPLSEDPIQVCGSTFILFFCFCFFLMVAILLSCLLLSCSFLINIYSAYQPFIGNRICKYSLPRSVGTFLRRWRRPST